MRVRSRFHFFRPGPARLHAPSLGRRLRQTLWRVRRLTPLRWISAVVCGLICFTLVRQATTPPSTQSWGPPAMAVRVRRAIAVGQTIRARDLSQVELPARALPASAVREAASARGRVALVALVPGEVLVAARLAPADRQGASALLGPGEVAVGVPTDATTPDLSVGDRVDVLATFGRDTVQGNEPTAFVVRSSMVVDVSERRVTIGVLVEDAPRVVHAVATADIALAVVP